MKFKYREKYHESNPKDLKNAKTKLLNELLGKNSRLEVADKTHKITSEDLQMNASEKNTKRKLQERFDHYSFDFNVEHFNFRGTLAETEFSDFVVEPIAVDSERKTASVRIALPKRTGTSYLSTNNQINEHGMGIVVDEVPLDRTDSTMHVYAGSKNEIPNRREAGNARLCTGSIVQAHEYSERMPEQSVSYVYGAIYENPSYINIPTDHVREQMGVRINFQNIRNNRELFYNLLEEKWEKLNAYLTEDTLTAVLEKLRDRLQNGKGPMMHVCPPRIFEEALRDADILAIPASETTEDLLRYELHFPSGCRMVVSIPMNKPNKMEKAKQKINE